MLFRSVCCGTMMDKCTDLCDKLSKDGYNPMLVNARFIKPIDLDMVKTVCENCQFVFTVEDNLKAGGFGSIFESAAYDLGIKDVTIYNFAFYDKFIEQGAREQLFKRYGLDGEGMYLKVKEILGKA